MGSARHTLTERLAWPEAPTEYALGLAAGAALGAALCVATAISPVLGAGVAAAIVGGAVIAIRPDLGMLLFLLLILVIEEFPSGTGETVERATRVPFYSRSLGVPGLYSTDVLLFGLIGLFGLHRVLAKRSFDFRFDAIAWSLVALGASATLSAALSILGGNPFAEADAIMDTSVGYEVNQRGAQLIGFFQFKIFAYLFATYALGQLFITSPRQIRQIVTLFLVAAVANIAVGGMRIVRDPAIVAEGLPLFYHSPSSWVFALTVFYVLLGWGHGLVTGRRAFWLGIVCAILMAFVLFSFRRTMWAAIALGGILLLLFLPARARLKLIVAGGAASAVLMGALLLSPIGSAMVAPIVGRVTETTVHQDTSTLYRLALLIHMFENVDEVPVFGYGVTPLWNKTVMLGYFRSNLENIHSLYFWFLLRLGWVGIVVALTGIGIWLYQSLRLGAVGRRVPYRMVGVSVFLALVMFLFSGLFNPVYGEARYMILTGLGLALVTRAIQFDRSPRKRAHGGATEPVPDPAS